MGLDMHLNVERALDPKSEEAEIINAMVVNPDDEVYLSYWRHAQDADFQIAKTVLLTAGLGPVLPVRPNGGYLRRDGERIIVEAVAVYWRKANAIHAWFVDNVQGGVDECRQSPVSREQLQTLLETAKEAIALYQTGDLAGARKLLPPRAGFFFGGTGIDAWYAEGIEHTVAEMERVLNATKDMPDARFSYRASW